MGVVNKVKNLKLPFGKYVVIGSGIFEPLGIRLAGDIDIAALPELHEQLRSTGKWEEEIRYNKIFLKRDKIEINPELSWSDYQTTTEEAIASATVIDDIPFMNLDELRKFKKALGREKDIKDIQLIDEYLSK